MTMFYSRMVETYQEIEATTKRLEITKLLVDLLKETPSEIVDKVVYLTQGKLYPDYLGIEVGIAEKLAIKCVSAVAGTTEQKVTAEYKANGDLGTAVEELLDKKTQAALQKKPLTVEDVYTGLDRKARQSLPGRGQIPHQNRPRASTSRRGGHDHPRCPLTGVRKRESLANGSRAGLQSIIRLGAPVKKVGCWRH